MALISISENTGDGNGNFMSYVKYDSKAGRAFRADKKDGVTTHVDITNTFKALFDFESVEIGYLRFPAAAAPETVLVPYGQQMPPRPAGEKWKMGIRMHIKLSPTIGGDVRELSSNANAFLRGINIIHDEYLATVAANPGKLPVVVLESTVPITSGNGATKTTNYSPVVKITGWAPRPAEMPLPSSFDGRVQQPGVQRPATNGAVHTPPPPVSTNTMHAPATQETVDDFG